MTTEISEFSKKVYQMTKRIPKGKVTTYGEIAKSLGAPKSVRAVGNALHKNPFAPKVPCHRVVNAVGQLAEHFGAVGGRKEQQKRLEAEGVIFEQEGRVDLSKYLFKFS